MSSSRRTAASPRPEQRGSRSTGDAYGTAFGASDVTESSRNRTRSQDTAHVLASMGGGAPPLAKRVSTNGDDRKGKKRRPGPIAFTGTDTDKPKDANHAGGIQATNSPFPMSAGISPYFLSSFVNIIQSQQGITGAQSQQGIAGAAVQGMTIGSVVTPQKSREDDVEGPASATRSRKMHLPVPGAPSPGFRSSLGKKSVTASAASATSNAGGLTPFLGSLMSQELFAAAAIAAASPLPGGGMNFSSYLPSPAVEVAGAGSNGSTPAGTGMNWASFLPASASAGFKPMGASTGNKRADADPNAASAADPESYADNCMLQQAASMLVGQAQAASLLLEQAKCAGILVDSPPSDLGPMSSDGFKLPQPPNTSFSGELPQPPRGAQNLQQSSQQLFAGVMLPTADQVFTPPPGTPATAWSLGLNAGLSAGLAASANIQQNGAMSPFLQAFASQFESKKTPGVGNMNAPFMAPSFATQSLIPNPAAGQPSGGGSFSGGSGAFGGTVFYPKSAAHSSSRPNPVVPYGMGSFNGVQLAAPDAPRRRQKAMHAEGASNIPSEEMFTLVGSKFCCKRCPHKSTRKSDIKKHFRTHTKTKPYKCTQCEASFSDASTRSRHIKAHAGQGRLKCQGPGCSKQFSRKSNMERHIKQAHLGEDPDAGVDSDAYKRFLAQYGGLDG